MPAEPTVTANDILFLNADHFIVTKQVLANNPTADNIHFIIYTNNNNLKIAGPVNERYYTYEMRITVSLTELRLKYNNIDDYTSGVLLRLFENFKPNLVLH